MTQPTDKAAPNDNKVEDRLARIESRLVQLMHYLKCDPTKRYGDPAPVRSKK